MKLLKTAEFVLWQYSLMTQERNPDTKLFINKVITYSHQMLSKPELKMFVTCVNGKPINQPHDDWKTCDNEGAKRLTLYKEALNRIWFEGCEIVEHFKGTENERINLSHSTGELIAHINLSKNWVWHYKTIEDIINEIDLTSTAAFDKEVGVNK